MYSTQQVSCYLRKVRSFNKSKYARNRQLARVIFYISLYINLIVIFGVFSIFYGLMFKFSNWWFLYFIFLSAFIVPSFMRVWQRKN